MGVLRGVFFQVSTRPKTAGIKKYKNFPFNLSTSVVCVLESFYLKYVKFERKILGFCFFNNKAKLLKLKA